MEQLELELWFSEEFSLLQDIQAGSGAHPASYSISIMSSFPGVKSNQDIKLVEDKKTWIYIDTPHTLSWSST
jgi:hypothetical protein